MKPRVLFIVALTALLPALGRIYAADAPKLLYDLGHGQTSFAQGMEPLAARIGVGYAESKEPLTAATLAGSRLLYLRTPGKTITAEERADIVRFVREGGSLLVIIDEEARQSLASTGVNELVAAFGLKFTTDLPYLHNCGAVAKAGAIHRADREIPYSGGRAVEGGTPFAFVLDRDGKPGEPIATSVEVPGGGRVIAMGEAMASILTIGKREGVRLSGPPRDARNTTYWGGDSIPFMEEVIAWLVKR